MTKWFRAHPFILMLIPLMVSILVCHFCSIPYPWSRNRTELLSLQSWQEYLQKRYDSLGIRGDELATISALTLGDKSNLSRQVKHAFAAAGAMHILAVSGLHTGIVFAVVIALLTGFGRWKPRYENRTGRWLLAGTIIAIMWCYAGITGWSPSVVRSVLMVSIGELAYATYRWPISLNVVAASAFMILIFRPEDLFSISFQLSYAAVVAILLFEPWFASWLPIPGRWRTHESLYHIAQYMRGCVTVSLAAQIGTIPLTIYYFHQVSNYFMLTNIIILPLAFGIVCGAVAVLALGGIPWVGSGLVWIVNHLTHWMNQYVLWIESLPGATANF